MVKQQSHAVFVCVKREPFTMEESIVLDIFRQGLREKTTADQLQEDFELALHHSDHNKTGEPYQKNDTIVREVSTFGCWSFSEDLSAVMSSKIHNIYQLIEIESMPAFYLLIPFRATKMPV